MAEQSQTVLDYGRPNDENDVPPVDTGVRSAGAAFGLLFVPLAGFAGSVPLVMFGLVLFPLGFLFAIIGASAPAATTPTRILAGVAGALNALATILLYVVIHAGD